MDLRMEDDPDWGRALAILRLVRGWSQARLGAPFGLAQCTVSTYELNLRPVAMPLLRRMTAAMGYPPQRLDRAHSLARRVRLERRAQDRSQPAAAAARVELLAARAGFARQELVRSALAAELAASSSAGEPAATAPPSRTASAPAPGKRVTSEEPPAAGATASPRRPDPALGRTLRVLRHLCDLDQDQLGRAVGLSGRAIQSYERDKRAPNAPRLERLLGAMDVSAEVFDLVRAFVERCRTPPGVAYGQSLAAQIEEVAAAEALMAEGEARAFHGRIELAARLLAGRQRAPALWQRLEPLTDGARRALVREAAEFQTAALSELLCAQSVKAAGDSARKAFRLARLAALAAERVEGPEGWCRRVQGYAAAHVANAFKVAERLPAAARIMARAAEQWRSGADHDPGLLNESWMLHLEAALRRVRREVPAALDLLEQAIALDHWGETPGLLIGMAKTIEELGDYTGSISLLREAAPQLDCEREPRSALAIHVNLAFNLCFAGQFGSARLHLPEVRALAGRLNNQLDNLRVGWLEAKVAAGMGDLQGALAGFSRVRRGFERLHLTYDAALVTVELAEVHATLGRGAEARRLALEAIPLFDRQEVHPEARRALEALERAAAAEPVRPEPIRQIATYLHRARHNPQLRFCEAA
jgi:transcriptional regulator with XRE-family HTH domain